MNSISDIFKSEKYWQGRFFNGAIRSQLQAGGYTFNVPQSIADCGETWGYLRWHSNSVSPQSTGENGSSPDGLNYKLKKI